MFAPKTKKIYIYIYYLASLAEISLVYMDQIIIFVSKIPSNNLGHRWSPINCKKIDDVFQIYLHFYTIVILLLSFFSQAFSTAIIIIILDCYTESQTSSIWYSRRLKILNPCNEVHAKKTLPARYGMGFGGLHDLCEFTF